MAEARNQQRRGSVRSVGLIVAGVVGAVAMGLLIYIASNTSPSPAGGTARPEIPGVLPPHNAPAGSGRRGATVEQMRSTRMQWADRTDPTRLAGEIICDAMEPLEEARFAVEKPRAWIYLRDGRVIYAEADRGNLHIPEQARGGRPESGRLMGNVRAMVFAPSERPVDPLTDEPLVQGRVETLTFDSTLGETKSSDELTVTFAQGMVKALGFTFVYNEVLRRLEYLDLGPGYGEVDPDAPERKVARAEAPAATPPTPSTSHAPPTPPTTARAAATGTPAEAEAAGGAPNAAGGEAKPEPARDEYYKAVFTGEVEATQLSRRISGERLEAWALLIDNSLRPGALGKEPRRESAPEEAGKAAAGAPVLAARPLELPARTPGEAPPPSIAEPPADAEPAIVRLTWSERVQVRPLEARPEELAADDVSLRFLSPKSGVVEMEDRERNARGTAAEFDYYATRRAAAWRHSEEHGVRLAQAGQGVLRGSDVRYDLAAGVGQVRGPGDVVRGAAAGEEGEDTREPGRVAWREQADFTLDTAGEGQVMRLRDAIFRGAVEARDADALARGEFVHALFAEGESGLYLSRVRINENAYASDGRGGELSGDDIDASFIAGESGPDPEFVAARGNVRVQRGDEMLRAGLLNAELRRAEDGGVLVTRVDARESVAYMGADGVGARADSLTADPQAQTAHLTGPSARVESGSSVVTGPSIRLDGVEREMNVDGPGTFSHEGEERDGFRPTVESRWVQRMRFNDRTGEVESEGATITRHVPEPLMVETVEAERVRLELSPLVEPGDGEEREPTPARRLLRALALGSEREPATVESRRVSAADEGVLEKLLYLEAPEIDADNEAGLLTAPGPGRMLSSDRGVERRPRAGEEDLGKGDALFNWRGSFAFDRAENKAIMTEEVHVTHLRTGAATPVELECRTLTAYLKSEAPSEGEEAAPAGGRLSRAVAAGAVWARSETGVEIVADNADYDAEKGVMLLSAVEGNEVAMFDPRSASPVRAREILWDLANDRIEIKKPSAVTPR